MASSPKHARCLQQALLKLRSPVRHRRKMQHATVPAHMKNTYLPTSQISQGPQTACRELVAVLKCFAHGPCLRLAWAAHAAVPWVPVPLDGDRDPMKS